MSMLKIVVAFWSVGLCVGDVSLRARPSWDFYSNSPVLTREYGLPPLPRSNVQVSRENVEFVGQLIEINTPNNQYSPPHSSSQLRQSKIPPGSAVFLPKEDPPKPFHTSTGNDAWFSKPGESHGTFKQQTVFGATQRLPLFQGEKQSKQLLSKQTLSSEYGPPLNSYPYPYPPSVSEAPPLVHEVLDETPFVNDDAHTETTDPTVIAVANASGRYYILGKDNTLQRVVYQTVRTKDDNSHNGFTAHLHYSPVEPIRDPIYGYDDAGHLVRLYNKK